MAGAVTSFKTGVRIDLGPAQGALKAPVTQDQVAQLLAQAQNHPGYQAHAERYEFRLRSLDGQAVLELKEKNWASQLKNVFSYSRRSEERLAASAALGRLFNLPQSDAQRMDGQTARAFAAQLPSAVQLVQDLQAGSLRLPDRSSAQWAQDLEATRQQASAAGLDSKTGFSKVTVQEHRDTTLSWREKKGFALFMGDFDRTLLPSAAVVPQAAAKADAQVRRWAEVREGPKALARGFKLLKLDRPLSAPGGSDPAASVDRAKRQLMSVVGPSMQKAWLASASERFEARYGRSLSLEPQAKNQMVVRLHSDVAWFEGNAKDWVQVEVLFDGRLQIDPPPPQGPPSLPFHATVQLRLRWEELAQPDFRFESRHVRDFSENLGQAAARIAPYFPWA